MEQFRVDEIENARNIPIQLLIGEKVGRTVKVRCPFHNERTPSCVIYADNSYHCFGCSAHGKNAIDFVMALGYSFSDAVKELIHNT